MNGVFPPGIEELVNKLQGELVPELDASHEWFDWQTLPLGSFYAGMYAIRQRLGPGRHKFVDVGSGIGTKLFLADHLGFEPWGIERRWDYVNVSSALFPEYIVLHQDALEYMNYDRFDVIYSYRIARRDDLQEKVNKHIVEHMREDAIFFATDTKDSTNQLMKQSGVRALI